MGIIKASVERPLTMLMFIIALGAIGFRGYSEMNVDRFPAVDFPFVIITTVFPGASPDDVEDLVVQPIEDAVAGIAGIDILQSTSAEGFGLVTIAFRDGVNGDDAALDVERQLSTVKAQFPNEVSDPSIIKADINAISIVDMILRGSGSQTQDDLFDIADEIVKPSFQTINGVASVSILGGRERIISVELDPAKLAAFDLSVGAISQAFGQSNLTFPVGSLDEGDLKSSVRSVGSFQSIAEIENLVIAGAPNPFGGEGGGGPKTPRSDQGGLVYLRDVATIRESFKDATVAQRYNGQDTVAMSVVKTTDANAIEVADQLFAQIEELNQTLPGGVELIVVQDTAEFTRRSVNSVQGDLILAVLITGFVMLLFLHNVRSTTIVLLAIPTSLLSTFLVMWMVGFTLNVLTLLALTLVIGILVDNSIVVIENIERHLGMGKTPKQAASDGPAEIGAAAISITLTDVIVYVPVAFTSGIVGQFFFSYGITIVAASMFSLFVSFTLAPLLASVLLNDPNEKPVPRVGLAGFLGKLFRPVSWFSEKFAHAWDASFVKLSSAYATAIKFSLRNFLTQTTILVIAIVALAGSLILIPQIGGEFAPAEDEGRFTVNLTLPPSSRLGRVDEAAHMAEQIILDEVPELVSLLTRVGSVQGDIFSGGTSGANTVRIQVQVTDKNDRERGVEQIVEELRTVITKIPDATVTLSAGGGAGPGGGIQVQIRGTDPNTLIDLSNEVEEVMRSTPGTVDVVNNEAARSPETKIRLIRQRVTDLGLSPALVATTLRTAVTGSDVGDFAPEGAEKTEINVRLNENGRANLDQLLQMPIGFIQGRPVLLEQVAEIERSAAPSIINRLDRQRVLTVRSGVTGSDSQGVADEIERRISEQVVFPPGYSFQFGGGTEAQREAFGQLGSALVLSIFLTYILLIATFQSFLQPLAIMVSLPLALIGVLWGLYLTDNTLNIFSLLGIIVLVGVVTRNAILIIDFANTLQKERGMTRKDALVEAGRLRLRPILMTSATLIFALLPVLLNNEAGAESRKPLAAVMMGGAVTSSFLSLLVIPVVYNAFENVGEGTKRLFNWLGGRREVTPEQMPPRPSAPTPAPEGIAPGD